MENPGEYLKRERELRGVSIKDIFEATRVPLKYLEALEADNYEALPHITFVKGYIKSYAKCLGLDETDAVLRYEIFLREKVDMGRNEKKESPQPPDLPKKKPAPKAPESAGSDRTSNTASVATLAAAGILIAVLAYFVSYGKKGADLSPQSAQKPAAVSAPALNDAPAGLKEGAVKDEAPRTTEASGVTEPPKADVAAKAPETPKVTETAVKVEAPKPKEPKEKVQAPVQQAGEGKHVLIVNASEVSWVKVKIDNNEPFDVLLKEGERISWKSSEGFDLTIGNAGGVELTFDGQRLEPLGGSKEVVRIKLPRSGE